MDVCETHIEELTALQAIYADDCFADPSAASCRVYIPSMSSERRLVLTALLPSSYPASTPPVLQLEGPLSDKQRAEMVQSLEALFTPGEQVLYIWVEWLREKLLQMAPPPTPSPLREEVLPEEEPHPPPSMESREEPSRPVPPLEACMIALAGSIVSGEAFTESKSTFQAHLAPVKHPEEVTAVMEVLLQNSKIQRATHNMLAYRLAEGDRVTHQDYDDDGEQAAGSRLLHLLQIVDARNVVVVVSRWFGGVKLGPARFCYINNAARQLLDQCGYVAGPGGEKKGARRK